MQGVFFRDSLRREAEAVGVAGWVANRVDGSVEAVLEGPEEAVKEVLRFASEGPPRAHVTDVQVTRAAPRAYRASKSDS